MKDIADSTLTQELDMSEEEFITRCTCTFCEERDTCPLAWDYYNLDGDCLMMK